MKSLLRVSAVLSLVIAAGTCYAQEGNQPDRATIDARPAGPGMQGNDAKPEIGAGMQDADAKALLEKSRDAIMKAKTLQFDVAAPQIGLMGGDRSPKNVKANMRLVRNETGQWLMRMTGSGTVAKESAPTEFDVFWERQSITWVDNQAKTVFTRPFGQARQLKTLQMINGLRMPNLTGDRPLGEEISQSVMKIVGQEDIGGVPCDVVVAGTSLEGQGNRKKVWIAKSDSLPRRIDNIIDSKLISATVTLELTNLKLDESLSREAIEIKPPEGYAVDKTEPVAPKPVQLTKMGVPEFELTQPDGAKVSKQSLAGSVAVVQFWGTWSNPSKRSHAELMQLAEQYKDKGVKFFLASVREKDAEGIAAYIKENNVTIPVLLEADTLAEKMDVQSVPTVLVMGADGANVKMVMNYLKDQTAKEIGEAIETALKEAAEKKAAPGGENKAETPAATGASPSGENKPADK
ncbi:MAG TPA: redoxin domain-containing protein [Phycisphaerales bacterium]